jgi:predicted phosphodiesterase
LVRGKTYVRAILEYCGPVRVAAVYDIHGNVYALRPVLAAADEAAVDLVLVGGDVAAGPMPIATIELLRSLGSRARFVRGNADRSMVGVFDHEREAAEWDGWPAAQLSRADRDFLAAFELTVELDLDGLGKTCFCHAVPTSDEAIVTAASPDDVLLEALKGTDARLVVVGHTHTQFDRRVGDRRLVNAGSVGNPCADRPGAYWALLGPEVTLRRTEYDFEAAAEAFLATGFPQREVFAQQVVRPPTAEEATAVFERRAGR